MTAEEKALIEKAVKGDPGAVVCVLKSYAPFVHRVAHGVVKNSADAADITQDVLIKAVSSLPRLRAAEGLQFWLYKTAYRLSLNWLRSRRRLEPFDDAVVAEPAAAEEGGSWSGCDDVERLTRIVDALPVPSYLIIRMFYFDERSCREIAATLGISVGAVKVQLHRARELIRERLARSGGT